VTWPVIEAHRDYTAGQLEADGTATTIHQRLVGEEHRPNPSLHD
jgi:hypothetical protein